MPTSMFPPMAAHPELEELARAAIARFNAMTPEEQRAHRAEQRRSWVRGELMLEHPDMPADQANALIDKII